MDSPQNNEQQGESATGRALDWNVWLKAANGGTWRIIVMAPSRDAAIAKALQNPNAAALHRITRRPHRWNK